MNADQLFRAKAPGIIAQLRGDFPIASDDGEAIVGNIGHECAGFTKLQEMKPTVKGSRGGWGWPQWTGPRRRAFEAYCKRNKLDPASDKANYAFLFLELKSSEKAAISKTRGAQGLFAKVRAFELAYLRAGVKHYDQREGWALKAREAYAAAGQPIAGTPPAEQLKTLRDEAEASDKRSVDAVKAGTGTGVGGTTGGGVALANHADWLLVGAFGLLVLAVVGAFAYVAWRNAQRAADLSTAADDVAEELGKGGE